MDYYKRKAISGVLFACFMVIMIRFGFFKSDSNQVDFSNRITIETIDYGDGQKAYIQKKGNDLIIQQSYQKDGKEVKGSETTKKSVFYGSPNQNDHQEVDSTDEMMLNFTGGNQAMPKFPGIEETHNPEVGVAGSPKYKQLRINGQLVDGVTEYVDDKGQTWYVWYYRDLKLKSSNNKMTFE